MFLRRQRRHQPHALVLGVGLQLVQRFADHGVDVQGAHVQGELAMGQAGYVEQNHQSTAPRSRYCRRWWNESRVSTALLAHNRSSADTAASTGADGMRSSWLKMARKWSLASLAARAASALMVSVRRTSFGALAVA